MCPCGTGEFAPGPVCRDEEALRRLRHKSRVTRPWAVVIRETPCEKRHGRAVKWTRTVVRRFAVRFQHGFCHAAVGAAFHLRAMPVLKVFLFGRVTDAFK
ncbi:hypothetical protein Bxe_B2787 [Paraburkholderia xenovorans LB400]|uniref:Uncharacterized protein n=1 Tax=Paraburkholderia xenovorans (strain LB400) TaxID=266265 RepID=Q13RT1_PARXL|nr:hypothetical protein Bxe_B2787 [Paraburkholderia xenovorans LB400]